MITNDGSEKFSGFVNISYHDNIIEHEDYELIGQSPNTINTIEIEYDILKQFKKSEIFSKLSAGDYYLYFEGHCNYSTTYTMDGNEYDIEVIVNNFYISRYV